MEGAERGRERLARSNMRLARCGDQPNGHGLEHRGFSIEQQTTRRQVQHITTVKDDRPQGLTPRLPVNDARI